MIEVDKNNPDALETIVSEIDELLFGLPWLMQVAVLRESALQLLDDEGSLNEDNVAAAFAEVIKEEDESRGQGAGRRPVRTRRVWEVFSGRVNEVIGIEEFVRKWEGEDPLHSAKKAISDVVSKRLSKYGYVIVPDRDTDGRIVSYRIKPEFKVN